VRSLFTPRGLRSRIVFALGGILLLFAAMAVALLAADERSDQMASLERSGRLFARYAGDHLYEAYASDLLYGRGSGHEGFARHIGDLMEINPELVRVALADPDGHLLRRAGSGAMETDPALDPDLAAWIATYLSQEGEPGTADIRQTAVDGQPVMQVIRAYRPGGILMAVAIYDLSLEPLQAHVFNTTVVFLIWSLLFFVLLGAALSLIVSRAVLHPVNILASAAQALGQGFLDARAHLPRGSAEMVVLARVFDTMAVDLKGTVAKLSSLGQEVSRSSASMLGIGHEMNRSTARQVIDTRRTGEGLDRMTTVSRRVAQGTRRASQLRESVERSVGEMTVNTQAIAGSAEALSQYVDRTHDAVMEISSHSAGLGDSAQALQKVAGTAAESITDMLASIEQVRGDVERSRQHAASAHQEAASIGTATMEEAMAGADHLRAIVDRAVGIIEKLSRRSQEVGHITTLIDEVTDRTNLLGINAAIMAAQAGEHGAGFAVVANEIKSLSIQIAGSTRDITAVLASMGEEAASAVKVIREGSASAAESVRLSAGLRDALNKIVQHSAETGRMLSAIAEATEQQSAGTRQLRSLADQVTALAQETAQATRGQRAFSARIIDAADGMRTLADQVTGSTQEHSTHARQVEAAMQNLRSGIETIQAAAEEQLQEAEPVEIALRAIQTTAESNQERASTLSETLTSLSLRADTLCAELSRFRFRDSPVEAVTPVVHDTATDDGERDPSPAAPAVEGRVAGQ
jgi:methyl-accepting chemotaxis protein